MPGWALRSTRFAFVDVETTGVDPASAVVEVGVQVVDCGRVVATFESLVDPGFPIPRFVTAIHGIDDEMVRGRPRLGHLVPRLIELTAGAVLVAHNASFDRRFLPFLAHRPSVCSYRLASLVVPEAPNHKNQTLGAFFGVRDARLNGRRPHRALADAIVTRHVFFRCLERYLAAGNPDELASLQAFVASHSERARSA